MKLRPTKEARLMSEAESNLSSEAFISPEAAAPMCGGALLKAARESQSMPIAALALALKVPVKKLEALEGDRFDLLPDIVFVRALAASICRSLKIDPAPILASLPNVTGVHLNSKGPAMSVPFRAPRDQMGASFWDQLSKPLIVVVLLLLLGGGVLVFAPLPQLAKLSGSSLPDTLVDSMQSAPTPAIAADVPLVLADTSTRVVDTLIARVNVPAGISEVPAKTEIVSPPAVPNMPALDVSAASSGASSIVVFTARGASWVEVVDSTATVKLRKTLADGDVVSATGVAPLSVVVGRADVVDVQWRNKPVDLMPVARENVARFEVK
jgi:cytoskeleton protein RodZ